MARAGMAATPPVPVPAPLRRLVRFARLSDTAVSTVRRVLDEDEQFRTYVCTALSLASLEQDLDEASRLFLQRPQGWETALSELAAGAAEVAAAEEAARAAAAATRRLDAVQAALARAEAERDRLQEQVAALRSQAADERRGRLTAQSDAGRLRKRVAELEQRSAEPAAEVADPRVDALRAAVADAEARAAAAEATAAEERARADAAARTPAAVPDVAPTPDLGVAPVDQRAVAEGVAAAVAAVGSLAEALARAAEALAPLTPAPAAGSGPVAPVGARPDREDGRTAGLPQRTPAPLPPALFDDTVEAAEHLVRIPGAVVLVDGYNVTLSAKGDLALADQRRWLLDAASGLSARTGAAVDVVFDGAARASSPSDRARRLGVQARFTAEGVEADDVLLDLVAALPLERPVIVVSDDRRVRDGARRLGANVVGVEQFVVALRR